ncbi:MAG: hypothetical protein LM590_09825 [Thermofilum sp.]|jgi:hypothetical protein|nr:hypothetical protein [Thermofilum sp.]
MPGSSEPVTRRKLVFIYDTANILSRIRNHSLVIKHVLSPLVLPSPPRLKVAILPIIERDLTRVREWNSLLEQVVSFAEMGVKGFDAYKVEEEFHDYLHDLKLALKALKVLRDRVSIISSLKLTSRDEYYLFVDPEPRVGGLDDKTRSSLESICRRLAECKNANVDEAVKDVEMYVAPYIDLIEASFGAVLITGDTCFRELVNSYAQQRGLGLGAVGVEVLTDPRKLSRALRSIISVSL